MALKLIAPGKRKGNKFYLLRGRVAGRSVEVSTKTTDRRVALGIARDVEARAAAEHARPGAGMTFGDAVDLWLRAKPRGERDEVNAERLRRHFVGWALRDVRPAHVQAAAHTLLPNTSPATKNRHVIAVAASILHFAAANGFCDHWPMPRFAVPQPAPRSAGDGVMAALLAEAHARGLTELHALLVLLAHQGWRLGEALALTWERVDTARGEALVWMPKVRAFKRVPLHPATLAALATLPRPAEPATHVFPSYRYRTAVYRVVRPLLCDLGIAWTPHMARHDFASDLDAAGVTPAGIAQVGTWLSSATVAKHYTHPDAKRAADTLAKLAPRTGAGRGERVRSSPP